MAKCKTKDNFNDPDYETESVAWLTLEQFNTLGRKLHFELVEKSHMIIELHEEYTSTY